MEDDVAAARAEYYAAKRDQDKVDPFVHLQGLLETGEFNTRIHPPLRGLVRWAMADRECTEPWRRMLGTLGVLAQTLGVGEVMHFGAQKYEWGSWKRVPNGVHRYQAAALRHLLANIYYPLDYGMDAESGLHHESHAACNIAFVLHLMLNGTGEEE